MGRRSVYIFGCVYICKTEHATVNLMIFISMNAGFSTNENIDRYVNTRKIGMHVYTAVNECVDTP